MFAQRVLATGSPTRNLLRKQTGAALGEAVRQLSTQVLARETDCTPASPIPGPESYYKPRSSPGPESYYKVCAYVASKHYVDL